MRPVTMHGALVCAILTFVLSIAPRAEAQFVTCPREAPAGTSVVIRSYHAFGLSTVMQPNPWPTAVSFAYDRAWRGWWDLNDDNFCYWWGLGFVSAGYSGWDGTEAVERRPNWNDLGRCQPYVFPVDQVAEADFRIADSSVPGTSGMDAVAYTSTCIGANLDTFEAETATLLHELGHGYGYGHFDGWLSIMNTSQTDVLSCAVGSTAPGSTTSMAVLPDAHGTQCHDIVYGVPPGIDISVTAVVQPDGCFLAAERCAVRPGEGPSHPEVFAVGATTGSTTVEFTQLNNRDTYGSANPVTAIYLSRDAYLDAGDVRVFSTTLPGNGHLRGEVHGRMLSFTFNPSVAMPITGANYRALVVVDDTNVVSEIDELNNITDTRFWYRRGP